MLTAHRIALKPNNKQATYFAKAAGTARFAYNWALAEWQSQYDAWKQDNTRPKPTEASLRRRLNAIKRERFPWMVEVSKNALQMAIIQLGVAFKNFFSGRARYPKFRKKGIRRQLTYKAEKQGGRVIVADRWFPSSKMCSACGFKNDALTLSLRSWTCPSCGIPHDRDINAAINLRNLAVSSTVSACGEEGSGVGRKACVKPASAKQEVSFVHA